MKYFCYTYSEHTPRAKGGTSHVHKTVKLYRIVRGVPKLVAQKTETFMDEFQLVMQMLEEHKQLHPEAFERNENTGSHKFYYASQLREAGYATVTRIG